MSVRTHWIRSRFIRRGNNEEDLRRRTGSVQIPKKHKTVLGSTLGLYGEEVKSEGSWGLLTCRMGVGAPLSVPSVCLYRQPFPPLHLFSLTTTSAASSGSLPHISSHPFSRCRDPPPARFQSTGRRPPAATGGIVCMHMYPQLPG